MVETHDQREWMRAGEAARFLAYRFGGRTRAQKALAIALHEGMLEARARAIGRAPSSDFGNVEQANDTLGLKIPTEVWHSSNSWQRDIDLWDWISGDFRVDFGPWPGDLHVFRDVRFARDQVDTLQPAMQIFSSLAPPPVPRDRTRTETARHWDWESALIGFIALVTVKGLPNDLKDLERRGGQKKLELWFATWFSERSRSDEVDQDRDAPCEGECRIRARNIIQAIKTARAQQAP